MVNLHVSFSIRPREMPFKLYLPAQPTTTGAISVEDICECAFVVWLSVREYMRSICIYVYFLCTLMYAKYRVSTKSRLSAFYISMCLCLFVSHRVYVIHKNIPYKRLYIIYSLSRSVCVYIYFTRRPQSSPDETYCSHIRLTDNNSTAQAFGSRRRIAPCFICTHARVSSLTHLTHTLTHRTQKLRGSRGRRFVRLLLGSQCACTCTQDLIFGQSTTLCLKLTNHIIKTNLSKSIFYHLNKT